MARTPNQTDQLKRPGEVFIRPPKYEGVLKMPRPNGSVTRDKYI